MYTLTEFLESMNLFMCRDEEESFPFPKTADKLKEEYEMNKYNHLQKKKMICWGVGLLSYVGAFTLF